MFEFVVLNKFLKVEVRHIWVKIATGLFKVIFGKLNNEIMSAAKLTALRYIVEFAIQTDSISSTLTLELFKNVLIFAISSSNDWKLQKIQKFVIFWSWYPTWDLSAILNAFEIYETLV